MLIVVALICRVIVAPVVVVVEGHPSCVLYNTAYAMPGRWFRLGRTWGGFGFGCSQAPKLPLVVANEQ